MKYILFIIVFVSCSKIQDGIKDGRVGTAIVNKPNIILILSDDIGYETMHYTGGQSYETPNLDAMAAQGIQFTNCHATPLCSPSRLMIMTGEYNLRNYTQWGKIDLTEKTFGNVMKDEGYTTCMAGKWQFNDGALAMQAFGFDRHLLFFPYYDSIGGGGCYKNPKLLQDGYWLQGAATLGKYGQDMYRDYIFNFIDSTTTPYFIYWTPNLCHIPFCPTPDDAAFASWNNPPPQAGDTVWYPSMMKYMDKLVGQLLDKVIGTNTIVLFVGDNGTDQQIHSLWNGQVVQGWKGSPITYGTHVPMIMWGAGSGTDSSLIDFTDFYPSLARMAGSADLGEDGISFYQRSQPAKQYLYFDFNPNSNTAPGRHCIWVMDKTYKKYDSVIAYPPRLKSHVYNYRNRPLEDVFLNVVNGNSAIKKFSAAADSIIKSHK